MPSAAKASGGARKSQYGPHPRQYAWRATPPSGGCRHRDPPLKHYCLGRTLREGTHSNVAPPTTTTSLPN